MKTVREKKGLTLKCNKSNQNISDLSDTAGILSVVNQGCLM